MNRFTSFLQAYKYIRTFTDYEQMSGVRYGERAYNLERMRILLHCVGNPHQQLKHIHIAGTKGKGSTAIMVDGILRTAGFKTGLYTSPHLIDMLERAQINGRKISKEDFIWAMNRMKPYLRKIEPTFFEIMTCSAFLIFEREEIDFSIVEVGLGGRLDSTNVITPIVTAITTIDYDHTDKLGNTLFSIAKEKAGIIKPNVPVVVASQRQEPLGVIKQVALKNGASLSIVGRDIKVTGLITAQHKLKFNVSIDGRVIRNIVLPLFGEHQAENAAMAIGIVNHCSFPISDDVIRRALREIRIPCRIEMVSKIPKTIVDVAHNPVSIKALVTTIRNSKLLTVKSSQLILVFAVAKDKDITGMLKEILPITDVVIFTKMDNPRACSPEMLLKMASKLNINGLSAVVIDKVDRAISFARQMAGRRDLILIAGSFYLAGEAMKVMDNRGFIQ